MSELVREIVEVHAFIGGDEKHPLLTVEAEGLAATAGWSKVRLDPHAYLTPPEDGFQDFDLVGVRPAHPAEAMLTEVEAAWEGAVEEWKVGVRVHAVDNMVEEEQLEPWSDDDEHDDPTDDADDATPIPTNRST